MLADSGSPAPGPSRQREAPGTPQPVARPADPGSAANAGPDPTTVEAAVAAFQSGRRREESFRFLFDTYYRRVQRFFARRTGSSEECLDLTQETFLRVYKGLEGYRGEAPFGAWLAGGRGRSRGFRGRR